MLKKDLEKQCFVYPSWAKFTYSWEDLPRLLSDPLGSGCVEDLGYTLKDYEKYGWSLEIQPFELIDGPAGGGIILAHIGKDDKGWLPVLLLYSEANVRSPDAMKAMPTYDYNVTYLEPRDEPGVEYGIGKRAKIYSVGVSAEHIESMPDDIFWLLRTKKSNRKIPGIDEIPQWGEHFGLQVLRLENPPRPVLSETEGWRKSEFDYCWFTVKGGGQGFGYNFAVMLYIALHLAYVGGRRIRSMHLLSAIEGKPNPYSAGKVGIY